MAALDSGDTDYDTDTKDEVGTLESVSTDTDDLRANGASRAIVAMQNKMGVELDGNKANLQTRLLVGVDADGKLQSPNGTDLDTRLLVAMDTAGLLKLSDVIQVQYATDNDDSAALTTNVFYDDSLPQNNEGNEVLTKAFTPKSTTSILEIVAILHVTVSTGAEDIVTALFVDSTADALAASSLYAGTAGKLFTVTLRHLLVSGSTSARTYKIRVGTASQDVFLNGTAASTRKLGGGLISSLRITEWQV